MNERAQKQNVKNVGVDDDYLCIELLSGLRLMGPLRTNPVYRDPVAPADTRAPKSDFVPAMAT
nr:hypothetical protein [uncultured Massilia sp.]